MKSLLFVCSLTVSLFWLTVLSVGIGAVTVSPAQVITILAEQVGLPGWVSYEPVQKAILLNIRLPRVVLAILTGAALAVSGAAMQGLFRNPLADPGRSEEHTSELHSRVHLVCRLLLETKKDAHYNHNVEH